MPRKVHISTVPRTPLGVNYRYHDVSADEVEFDDEISVKSSLFKVKLSTRTPKSATKGKKSFVLRKSTDLKRFTSPQECVAAILASPMVSARKKTGHLSQSFPCGDASNGSGALSPQPPLTVPSNRDVTALTSRRISQLIINRHSANLQAQTPVGRRGSLGPSLSGARPSLRLSMKARTSDGRSSSPWVLADNDENNENQTPLQLHASCQDVEDSENVLPEAMDSHFQPMHVSESSSLSDFRLLVMLEGSRLSSLKCAWEAVVDEEDDVIPEVALGSIRTAIGKCGLLVTKKLPFFESLVVLAEQSEQGIAIGMTAGVADLLGYWSTISGEIANIDCAFERLRTWRETANWAADRQPQTPARSQIAPSKGSRIPGPNCVNTLHGRTITTSIAKQLKVNERSVKRILSNSNKKSITTSKAISGNKTRSNFAKFRAGLLSKRQTDVDAPTDQNWLSFTSASPTVASTPAPPATGKSIAVKTVQPIDLSSLSVSVPTNTVVEELPRGTPKTGRRSVAGSRSTGKSRKSSVQLLDSSLPGESDQHWAVPKQPPPSLRSQSHRRRLSSSTSFALTPAGGPLTDSVDQSYPSIDTSQQLLVPDSQKSLSSKKKQRRLSQTPISVLRLLSPPPRPATGTPRPRFPTVASLMHAVATDNTSPSPATMASPASRRTPASSSRRQSAIKLAIEQVVGTPHTPSHRYPTRKSVRFTSVLASTPGGHSGGSGSPRGPFPVTPHSVISLDPSRYSRHSSRLHGLNSTSMLAHSLADDIEDMDVDDV